jgi:hypothetical protein
MKPSSIAEPRSVQQWLPDLVFGFENLASHKLRSLLTMLGMIFGVAAVVAMLSIGAGAQQKVMAFIEQLGVRNLIVEAKESHNWQELQKVRKNSPGLTLSDYQIIRKNVPISRTERRANGLLRESSSPNRNRILRSFTAWSQAIWRSAISASRKAASSTARKMPPLPRSAFLERPPKKACLAQARQSANTSNSTNNGAT